MEKFIVSKKTCCIICHQAKDVLTGCMKKGNRYQAHLFKLRAEILRAIARGSTHFMCSLFLGDNIDVAEIVLSLKDIGCMITLECVVPCKYQQDILNFIDYERCLNVLQKADKVVCLHTDSNLNNWIVHQNKYMIEHSDNVIALWNEDKKSAVFSAMESAKKLGKATILYPQERSIKLAPRIEQEGYEANRVLWGYEEGFDETNKTYKGQDLHKRIAEIFVSEFSVKDNILTVTRNSIKGEITGTFNIEVSMASM